MRIGLEASTACLETRTGCAIYTVNLINALIASKRPDDDFSLYYRLSRYRNRQHRFKPPGGHVRWYQPRFLPILNQVDVIHGTDNYVPDWQKAARMVTIHDLAVLLFKGTWFSPEKFRNRKWSICRKIAQTAHLVVAVSERTKTDFAEFFDFPEDRIRVVYEGVDPKFHPQSKNGPRSLRILNQYGLTDAYLLFVGAISGRKNALRLVEAYYQSTMFGEVPLVLAGGMSYFGEPVRARVAELGIERHVRFLGYVPDDHLPALYAKALAFLFPTIYEGFGLPVLEAMASGTPVLVGSLGAAPEIASGHAITVDPFSIDAICDGIHRVVNIPSDKIDLARAHANQFTWTRCAQETRDLYDQAVAIAT